MAKLITVRYAGQCRTCTRDIKVGEKAYWRGRGVLECSGCFGGSPRENAEYALGIADGRRYSENRQLFGDQTADRIAMDEEMARYNAGEDY